MSATITDQAPTTWRHRRRHKRRTRPMYRRADRAIVRSLITLTVPAFTGASVVAWQYLHEDDIKAALIAAAITGAVWAALTPLALWWAISGLRRGTRMVITGVLAGVVAGVGVVGLVAGTYGAAVGWTLITAGDPLPEPFQDVAVPMPSGLR